MSYISTDSFKQIANNPIINLNRMIAKSDIASDDWRYANYRNYLSQHNY